MTSLRDVPLDASALASTASTNSAACSWSFPDALLCAHQWMMEGPELLAHFLALCQSPEAVTNPELRKGAVNCVARWIRLHPHHFDGCPAMCQLVDRMKSENSDLPEADALDLSQLPSCAWLRSVSVRHASKQISLAFDQWNPVEIAAALSLIDYKGLCRVTVHELKRYVREGKLAGTPLLERSISIFNNISHWTQCMVLSKGTPEDRAIVLAKFVQVGLELRALHNFNTLMAVVGGITHSSIARLQKTNAAVPEKEKQELNSLSVLLTMQSNFANYRKALKATEGRFRVPIMGVHLKDLIAANLTGADFERARKITRRKVHLLAGLLSHFLAFNTLAHNFPDPNIDLLNTLKVSLDIRYNEDDIYELSLRREPRTRMSQPDPRPAVFAAWAAGVSAAPDVKTVHKHVTAMVDAVFKHYDHDRDGHISQAEYMQISGNFPFIDPFANIDADRDGRISKEEMRAYFVKANSTALRRGFKHDFRDTTLLTPTVCGHCGKLLWGLLRQCCKCKDCGISTHTSCKDEVVAECRKRECGRRTRRPASFKEKLLIHCRSPRLRSASTAVPAPQAPPPSAARPVSESADCLSSAMLTPDELRLASLACEEVFDSDDEDDTRSCPAGGGREGGDSRMGRISGSQSHRAPASP